MKQQSINTYGDLTNLNNVNVLYNADGNYFSTTTHPTTFFNLETFKTELKKQIDGKDAEIDTLTLGNIKATLEGEATKGTRDLLTTGTLDLETFSKSIYGDLTNLDNIIVSYDDDGNYFSTTTHPTTFFNLETFKTELKKQIDDKDAEIDDLTLDNFKDKLEASTAGTRDFLTTGDLNLGTLLTDIKAKLKAEINKLLTDNLKEDIKEFVNDEYLFSSSLLDCCAYADSFDASTGDLKDVFWDETPLQFLEFFKKQLSTKEWISFSTATAKAKVKLKSGINELSIDNWKRVIKEFHVAKLITNEHHFFDVDNVAIFEETDFDDSNDLKSNWLDDKDFKLSTLRKIEELLNNVSWQNLIVKTVKDSTDDYGNLLNNALIASFDGVNFNFRVDQKSSMYDMEFLSVIYEKQIGKRLTITIDNIEDYFSFVGTTLLDAKEKKTSIETYGDLKQLNDITVSHSVDGNHFSTTDHSETFNLEIFKTELKKQIDDKDAEIDDLTLDNFKDKLEASTAGTRDFLTNGRFVYDKNNFLKTENIQITSLRDKIYSTLFSYKEDIKEIIDNNLFDGSSLDNDFDVNDFITLTGVLIAENFINSKTSTQLKLIADSLIDSLTDSNPLSNLRKRLIVLKTALQAEINELLTADLKAEIKKFIDGGFFVGSSLDANFNAADFDTSTGGLSNTFLNSKTLKRLKKTKTDLIALKSVADLKTDFTEAIAIKNLKSEIDTALTPELKAVIKKFIDDNLFVGSSLDAYFNAADFDTSTGGLSNTFLNSKTSTQLTTIKTNLDGLKSVTDLQTELTDLKNAKEREDLKTIIKEITANAKAVIKKFIDDNLFVGSSLDAYFNADDFDASGNLLDTFFNDKNLDTLKEIQKQKSSKLLFSNLESQFKNAAKEKSESTYGYLTELNNISVAHNTNGNYFSTTHPTTHLTTFFNLETFKTELKKQIDGKDAEINTLTLGNIKATLEGEATSGTRDLLTTGTLDLGESLRQEIETRKTLKAEINAALTDTKKTAIKNIIDGGFSSTSLDGTFATSDFDTSTGNLLGTFFTYKNAEDLKTIKDLLISSNFLTNLQTELTSLTEKAEAKAQTYLNKDIKLASTFNTATEEGIKLIDDEIAKGDQSTLSFKVKEIINHVDNSSSKAALTEKFEALKTKKTDLENAKDYLELNIADASTFNTPTTEGIKLIDDEIARVNFNSLSDGAKAIINQDDNLALKNTLAEKFKALTTKKTDLKNTKVYLEQIIEEIKTFTATTGEEIQSITTEKMNNFQGLSEEIKKIINHDDNSSLKANLIITLRDKLKNLVDQINKNNSMSLYRELSAAEWNDIIKTDASDKEIKVKSTAKDKTDEEKKTRTSITPTTDPLKTGEIIGIVLGALVMIVLISTFLFKILKPKKTEEKTKNNEKNKFLIYWFKTIKYIKKIIKYIKNKFLVCWSKIIKYIKKPKP